MSLTYAQDELTCIYDLNRGADELLPVRHSRLVRCTVHPDDVLSRTPSVTVNIDGCRTYGDVFKRIAEHALRTLPMEYDFRTIRLYNYNNGSGEAEAEMGD